MNSSSLLVWQKQEKDDIEKDQGEERKKGVDREEKGVLEMVGNVLKGGVRMVNRVKRKIQSFFVGRKQTVPVLPSNKTSEFAEIARPVLVLDIGVLSIYETRANERRPEETFRRPGIASFLSTLSKHYEIVLIDNLLGISFSLFFLEILKLQIQKRHF